MTKVMTNDHDPDGAYGILVALRLVVRVVHPRMQTIVAKPSRPLSVTANYSNNSKVGRV